MATYFISDLHLQPSQPGVARGFFKLLDSIEDAEALYILGDFFEFWIGDDYSDPFVDQIKHSLKVASQRFPIFFMHGNRDFMIGNTFCEETGMQLLEDPSVVEIHGQPVLLMHGDSLCTKDTAYIQMRSLLRNPAWQASMLAKPIEERLEIARKARAESQSKDPSMAASDIMDVTPEEVIKAMDQAGVQILIHGHTHRPKVHNVETATGPGRRMVLGDWHDTGWLIKAQNGQFELIEFDI